MHPYGRLKLYAVMMPASASGQSLICKASSWAAITTVGGSRTDGLLCCCGFRNARVLANRANSSESPPSAPLSKSRQ